MGRRGCQDAAGAEAAAGQEMMEKEEEAARSERGAGSGDPRPRRPELWSPPWSAAGLRTLRELRQRQGRVLMMMRMMMRRRWEHVAGSGDAGAGGCGSVWPWRG